MKDKNKYHHKALSGFSRVAGFSCLRQNVNSPRFFSNFFKFSFSRKDSSLAWLTEVVLLGSGDARLAELCLNEETKILLEMALGSSRGPAGGLWARMEEYARSRGPSENTLYQQKHLFLYKLLPGTPEDR